MFCVNIWTESFPMWPADLAFSPEALLQLVEMPSLSENPPGQFCSNKILTESFLLGRYFRTKEACSWWLLHLTYLFILIPHARIVPASIGKPHFQVRPGLCWVRTLSLLRGCPFVLRGFCSFLLLPLSYQSYCNCLTESGKSLRQYHRGMNCPVCSVGHFKFSAEQ